MAKGDRRRGVVWEGGTCASEECEESLKQGVNQLSIRMFFLLGYNQKLETFQ